MTLQERIGTLPHWMQPWARLAWRFARFGVVGGSGIVVNQLVFYVGRIHLFADVANEQARQDYALILAIAIATTYNFFWNRLWTWHERRGILARAVTAQYAKYVFATLIGSTIQFFLTRWFASADGFALGPQIANLIAIGMASIVNFLINDRLTFRKVNV